MRIASSRATSRTRRSTANASTMWHTAWSPQPIGPPHEIVLEMAKPAAVTGLAVLPRQDNNRNGWIEEYACYVSDDGTNWGESVAQGRLAADAKRQEIRFARPRPARFIRLVALKNFADGPWSSIAELEVLLE